MCPKHRGCPTGLSGFFTAKHSRADAGKDGEDLGDASVVLACSPVSSPEGPGGVQGRTAPSGPWCRGKEVLSFPLLPRCSSRIWPCSLKPALSPGHVCSSQVRPELCACRHPPPPAVAQMPPKTSCLAKDAWRGAHAHPLRQRAEAGKKPERLGWASRWMPQWDPSCPSAHGPGGAGWKRLCSHCHSQLSGHGTVLEPGTAP